MSAAQILHKRKGLRPCKGGQLAARHPSGEADLPEVAWMDPNQGLGLGADRPAIVPDAGPVCGPHLPQNRLRGFKYVGNPESVADLDQLAPRNDDLASARQFVQDEEDGGRIVVDDDAGCADQALDQLPTVDIPLSAESRREIVLEIGVGSCRLDDGVNGHLSKRRTSQIGVKDHARSVDHGAQGIPQQPFDGLADQVLHARQALCFGQLPPGENLGANLLDGAPHKGDDSGPRQKGEPADCLVGPENLVDAWQRAEHSVATGRVHNLHDIRLAAWSASDVPATARPCLYLFRESPNIPALRCGRLMRNAFVPRN